MRVQHEYTSEHNARAAAILRVTSHYFALFRDKQKRNQRNASELSNPHFQNMLLYLRLRTCTRLVGTHKGSKKFCSWSPPGSRLASLSTAPTVLVESHQGRDNKLLAIIACDDQLVSLEDHPGR